MAEVSPGGSSLPASASFPQAVTTEADMCCVFSE